MRRTPASIARTRNTEGAAGDPTMITERLTLEGHLLDESTLARLFGGFDRCGVTFRVRRFRVGAAAQDPSLVEVVLHAPDAAALQAALDGARALGAVFSLSEARLAVADVDGVLPDDFYSTTNFTTHVRVDGAWIAVERLEMDVGIRIVRGASGPPTRAEACPMHRARRGDVFVVGHEGVRVSPTEEEERDEEEFRFMKNEISSERSKARMIAHCAEAMRAARTLGQKILFVGGPAIVHSGSAPLLEGLIRGGWVDVLFAGNALAAHDIEAAMFGTSLGVDVERGAPAPHGHSHHLRAINRVRRAGSIATAARAGLFDRGVMHACVARGVPFVLCGSIRDDGPLPDVVSDTLAACDAMREHVPGVGVAIIVATTLHGVATGNILPASVKTYCVDSDADTVIKLTDRGTHQAVGLVTDCEFFLTELARRLG
jgi:lysine-ketoglutarate reductase/saccharopine dehydrogenase-like protein (TIGR00300 family)